MKPDKPRKTYKQLPLPLPYPDDSKIPDTPAYAENMTDEEAYADGYWHGLWAGLTGHPGEGVGGERLQ